MSKAVDALNKIISTLDISKEMVEVASDPENNRIGVIATTFVHLNDPERHPADVVVDNVGALSSEGLSGVGYIIAMAN